MLNVLILRVAFSYCYAECHYAGCHYAACLYAKYHYAGCHYGGSHYGGYHYAGCHYAGCLYAKFHVTPERCFTRVDSCHTLHYTRLEMPAMNKTL
jgi:hypothetical protein